MLIDNKKIKICFAASSGGHFEQLLMLKPLMKKYNSFILTEKTSYEPYVGGKIYFLKQINRKERNYKRELLKNAFRSLKIFIKERPDFIITTGVLSMIPMALICKLFGKKLIYIESFAKITTPTKTGRLLYHFADKFYVQWKPLLKYYPNAIYLGGIY